MWEGKQDRRRFQRIFFAVEDDVKGTFISQHSQQGLLTAVIINLSESGIGLLLSKNETTKKLGKGDHLILTQLNGIKELESLTNIKAEIKWMMENPDLGFIGCGCEFHDVPKPMRKALQTFIDVWSLEKTG